MHNASYKIIHHALATMFNRIRVKCVIYMFIFKHFFYFFLVLLGIIESFQKVRAMLGTR